MDRIKNIAKKLFRIIRKPEMLILPANLAFFLVLSVFPIIIIIGIIASSFSLSLDEVVNFLNTNLPSQVADIIVTFISGKGIDFNVGFFTITAFILASNGPHSIIVTSNTLYNFKQGSYLNRRIKAFILTIILVFLFIFILIILAFGNFILKAIFEIGILKSLSTLAYHLFVYLKWPFAFFIIFFSIKLIYTIAPDKNIPSKLVNRGAIFSTLGWILTTAIYSYYVAHFSKYDIFYGSLSNIIILMMYIYFLSYILVLGVAINSNYYEKFNELENNSSIK